MYLCDDVWRIIIKYQYRTGDYNPAVFCRQYKRLLNERDKNWK